MQANPNICAYMYGEMHCNYDHVANLFSGDTLVYTLVLCGRLRIIAQHKNVVSKKAIIELQGKRKLWAKQT